MVDTKTMNIYMRSFLQKPNGSDNFSLNKERFSYDQTIIAKEQPQSKEKADMLNFKIMRN